MADGFNRPALLESQARDDCRVTPARIRQRWRVRSAASEIDVANVDPAQPKQDTPHGKLSSVLVMGL